MTRLVQTQKPANERKKLLVSIKLTQSELEKNNDLNRQTKDQAAFISMALLTISAGINTTVEPWEKRGYWVKADRFRTDWAWTGKLGMQLREAILREDWGEILQINKRIAEKLLQVKIPLKSRFDTPWTGAWQKLKQ